MSACACARDSGGTQALSVGLASLQTKPGRQEPTGGFVADGADGGAIVGGVVGEGAMGATLVGNGAMVVGTPVLVGAITGGGTVGVGATMVIHPARNNEIIPTKKIERFFIHDLLLPAASSGEFFVSDYRTIFL